MSSRKNCCSRAKNNTHELIADAIGRMKRGTLLVNSPKHPQEIDLPFDLEGAVATVDATGIAGRLLRRNPPPVGLTLLGAYARITEAIDLGELLDVIRETFPGAVVNEMWKPQQRPMRRCRPSAV